MCPSCAGIWAGIGVNDAVSPGRLGTIERFVRVHKKGFDRHGSVPKLVIATSSGTEAFDRAAVAGVSASNPFPPLPAEFKGDQIRLQLAFSYNAARH